MNPILAATLRRHWPLFGAGSILLAFLLVHQAVFQPAARRYRAAVDRAGELGLALDPAHAQDIMPPRVFAVVADNAMPSSEAQELGNSGVLTARLLEDITRSVSANGMEVIQTEPGPVTQLSRSVTVRAYLKIRGRYDAIVALLDGLARGRTLVAVDRFTLTSQGTGEVLDVWVSRYVVKQDRAKR